MANKITYTVETLDWAYANHIPWGNASRAEGLTERKAISLHNQADRIYHPDANSWSGHVRIVGSDDWIYTVSSTAWFSPVPPVPGERATLQRLYHLDDIA